MDDLCEHLNLADRPSEMQHYDNVHSRQYTRRADSMFVCFLLKQQIRHQKITKINSQPLVIAMATCMKCVVQQFFHLEVKASVLQHLENIIAIDKRGYPHNIFLISRRKHMLCGISVQKKDTFLDF